VDEELRAAEHSGEAFKQAVHLQRAGRLDECADTLERAWLEGSPSCGDALFHFLDEWRGNHAAAVATRLDRLACAGNDRARGAWEKWFPDLTKILGMSDNMQGLRRTVLEQVERPRDSILVLKGDSGVGKRTAARVLHELTKGSEFVEWEYYQSESMPRPPENGTFFVHAMEPGAWEAPCVEGCRNRRTRLVISYHDEAGPPWQTLHGLDHVDYYITPLDSRREDVPDLIVKRFPEWLRGILPQEPDFARFKTIRVQPEAIWELSRRSWRNLNARGVFYALHGAALNALRSSDNSETLAIGVEHLGRLGTA
jgi:hypothetical protein